MSAGCLNFIPHVHTDSSYFSCYKEFGEFWFRTAHTTEKIDMVKLNWQEK